MTNDEALEKLKAMIPEKYRTDLTFCLLMAFQYGREHGLKEALEIFKRENSNCK